MDLEGSCWILIDLDASWWILMDLEGFCRILEGLGSWRTGKLNWGFIFCCILNRNEITFLWGESVIFGDGYSLLKDHEGRWRILKDLDRSWRALKDLERSWRILKDLDGSWWILMDLHASWWIVMDLEGSWRVLDLEGLANSIGASFLIRVCDWVSEWVYDWQGQI